MARFFIGPMGFPRTQDSHFQTHIQNDILINTDWQLLPRLKNCKLHILLDSNESNPRNNR